MPPDLDAAMRLMKEPGEESLEKALRALEPTVFSFSMKLCRQRDDAEDTMQEVLISSLRHLTKLENPRALSVWLYTVARNRCAKIRKRQSARRAAPLDDLTEREEVSRREHALFLANPEQSALRSEVHSLIHNAVLRLPLQYNRILTLHDLDEFDTSQIARMLALHPGTVRVQLHRARVMLRREVGSRLGLPRG